VRRLALIPMVLLALLAPARVSAASIEPPGDVYLALGNSLAVGYEAPANSDGQPGYPTILYERMRGLNPDLQLNNLGVVGETSSTLISGGQLAGAESVIASARAAGQCVGAITLDIGGNDFGQILTRETTPEAAIPQFRSNLATILARVTSAAHNQMAGCSPRIALMDYYNPYPGLHIPPTNQPLADMYLPTLNAIIRDTAADYGVAVANVQSAFVGSEEQLIYVNQAIYSNPLLLVPFLPWFEGNVDFHPRPAGHQVIADQFWQALQLVPDVPALADLPDLLPANVSLVAPWTCGECALGGRQQAALAALPEPGTVGIEWLGVQLWNRVTRPILCWLLAMFQTGLNLYAGTLNQFWIPAFNLLYKLLYELFCWLTSAFSAWWYLGEDIRYQIWSVNATLASQAGGALTQATTGGAVAEAMLRAWVAVFTGALAPWRYFVGMYLGTAQQIVVVIVDLDAYKPAQLTALEGTWILAAVKGTLRGIYESQLGWFLVAQVGMFYLATALYVVDKAGEV
jgi:lysophospholipase L1-like esterase